MVCVPIVLPPTSTRFSVTDGVAASSDHMSRAFGIDASCLLVEVGLDAALPTYR